MAVRAGKVAARSARYERLSFRVPWHAPLGRTRRFGPGLLQALDSLPHGFCLFDTSDRLVFVSASFRHLFGARVRPGQHARDVSAAATNVEPRGGHGPADLWAARRRLLARGETGPVLQVLPDGRQIAITIHPQADGGWAALCEDVTERRRAETLLRYMAQHDPLTGLANRYLFTARLDRALAGLQERGCALLCIDLDGFKLVNDRYGHAVGDALLRHMAERLQASLGDGDIAARIGGDEFVVLLGGADAAAALDFAHRLHARLGAPYELGAGQPVRVAAAIGLACAPLHAARAQSLVERADAAMYEAKRLGTPYLWDEAILPGSAPAGILRPV